MAELITQHDSSRARHVSQHGSRDIVDLLGRTHATTLASSPSLYENMGLHVHSTRHDFPVIFILFFLQAVMF